MWNLSAAVAHLKANAQPEPIGRCGQYTREAIEAGGLRLTQHTSAKDYGSSLLAVGFSAVFESTATLTQTNGDYAAAKKGDVVVMSDFTDPSPPPGYKTYHMHGHMQMYDGTRWISDFKQRTFYPGPPYRRAAPDYVVYRFAVTAPEPANDESLYSLLPDTPYSWLPDLPAGVGAGAGSAAGASPSAGVAPSAGAPPNSTKYIVKAGDSLGLIALSKWNDALLWPLIHDDNQSTIGANANAISPGTELVIRDISNLTASQRAATRERGRSW